MPFFVILQELACAKRLEFFWSVANIHISVQFEFINTMFSSPYGITTELIKIQSCLAAKHAVPVDLVEEDMTCRLPAPWCPQPLWW
jgi:hypothetical protein